MTTRPLYSTHCRPVRARNTQQWNSEVSDDEQLQDNITPFNNAERLGMASFNSSQPDQVLSNEELRTARVNKYQQSYDQDKEEFKIKKQEKERKKLMQKLERYKGVGELGFKLSEDNTTKEESEMQFWKSRDYFQHSQDSASRDAEQNSSLEELKQNEVQVLASMKSLILDSPEDTSSGQKLGGNHAFQRARGEHPLLSRLQVQSHDSQN